MDKLRVLAAKDHIRTLTGDNQVGAADFLVCANDFDKHAVRRKGGLPIVADNDVLGSIRTSGKHRIGTDTTDNNIEVVAREDGVIATQLGRGRNRDRPRPPSQAG